MQFKKSEYNPLKKIFSIMDSGVITITDIIEIKLELELGGIHAENEDEFNTLLESLVDINPRKYGKQT